jgi:hypothetical protein
MKSGEGWLHVVVGRVCGFLFSMSAILAALFVMGNTQEFLDSTQVMLLNSLQVVTLLFLIVSVYYIGLLVFLGIRLKRLMTARLVAVFLGVIINVSIFGFINFLETWVSS